MGGDNLKRHMKVHDYDEIEEDDEDLKKYLIESTTKYKEKIALGKRIYMTLAGYSHWTFRKRLPCRNERCFALFY